MSFFLWEVVVFDADSPGEVAEFVVSDEQLSELGWSRPTTQGSPYPRKQDFRFGSFWTLVDRADATRSSPMSSCAITDAGQHTR